LPADLHDCRESRFVKRQRWLNLPGALDEQLNGAVLGQRREALRRRLRMWLLMRVGESINVEQPFGLHLQALPRGHHDRDMRRVRKNSGHQIGPLKQMLEVIEHKQHVPRAQLAEQVGARV